MSVAVQKWVSRVQCSEKMSIPIYPNPIQAKKIQAGELVGLVAFLCLLKVLGVSIGFRWLVPRCVLSTCSSISGGREEIERVIRGREREQERYGL